MTRVQDRSPAPLANFFHHKGKAAKPLTGKTPPTLSTVSTSKRSWCCFCPGEAPRAAASKQGKAFGRKAQAPVPPPPPPAPVSSQDAGAAPRIDPVKSFGPVSESRHFDQTENVIDFSHWR